MKFTKSVSITLLFALLTIGSLQAQRPDGSRGGRNIDPVERANAQTEKMIQQLELSTAQGEKIKAVNLEFAQKMATVRAEAKAAEDWSSMRESMKALRVEQKATISKYLTAEQTEKWVQLQAARAERGQGKKREKGKGRGKGEKKAYPKS